jgi:hypothetical protein
MVCDVVVGTLIVPEAVKVVYRIPVPPDMGVDTVHA